MSLVKDHIPKFETIHIGKHQILVDINSLDVDMIFLPERGRPNINNIKNEYIVGLHPPCQTQLKYYDGMVICEKCEEIINLDSI